MTVTMMPQSAEELMAPRIVGVEFPFGMPHDRRMQRTVLDTAVTVLAGATAAGTRVDVDIEWPQPRGEAYKSWQPAEPSPIVAQLLGRP